MLLGLIKYYLYKTAHLYTLKYRNWRWL